MGPNPRYGEIWSELGDGTLSKDQWIEEFANVPLWGQPEEKWYYGRAAYEILGYLIEVISGLPFDKFLEEKIFIPLNMLDTGFFITS